MKVKWFCALALILTIIPLAEVGAQKMYMPDDEEVRDLNALYSASGMLFPTTSYPVTKKELKNYAEILKERTRRSEIRNRTEEYLEALDYGNTSFYAGFGTYLTVEKYFDTAQAVGDIRRDFLEMPGLATLNLMAGSDRYGGCYVHSPWKREYVEVPKSNFFEPDPDKGNPVAFENMTVYQGVLFLNAGPLVLGFGRTPLHYGSGRFSTIMPGKHVPFLDALFYKLHMGRAMLSSHIATLENRQGIGEETIEGFEFGQNVIISTVHRFEIAWDRVRFSLASHSIISRRENGILFGDVFPAFSWHNAAVGPHNLCVYGDVAVSFIPGFEFYFQVGYDEVSATDLIGVADTDLPTIDSYVGGISYDHFFGSISLHTAAEFGITHYLWGNYWREDSSFGNYFDRAIYRLKTDNGYRIIPLTSPYGPGTEWVNLTSEADFGRGFTGDLSFFYLRKNTLTDLVETEHVRNDEAMKAARRSHTFSVGLGGAYSFRDIVSAYIEPEYYYSDGNSWFHLTLGVRTGYDVLLNMNY